MRATNIKREKHRNKRKPETRRNKIESQTKKKEEESEGYANRSK